MPTSNAEELRLFLKCTVIGRGVFGPCTCCWCGSKAVLENRILPSLYRSRKHSDKDVSSVVIHCRKFFSHFPHIGFGRINHNASLPDRWLQQVIFTFDQAAQPESSAVLSCYG